MKPKVITDKAHKTNDATKATSTSVNASSQSTKITSQQRGATTMNLNEISQGSYGSLLGDWKEVASSVNKHDTKGDVWQSPEAGAKLTVKDTKISDGEMALASGKFEDANGDEEAVTTTIKQEKAHCISMVISVQLPSRTGFIQRELQSVAGVITFLPPLRRILSES